MPQAQEGPLATLLNSQIHHFLLQPLFFTILTERIIILLFILFISLHQILFTIQEPTVVLDDQ